MACPTRSARSELFRERAHGGRRDHRADVAPEAGDLLHERGAHEALLDRRHEEHRGGVRGELPVVVGELHLGLEVRDGSEAPNDRRRPVRMDRVDGEAVEGLDAGPTGVDAGPGDRLAEDADPDVARQERALARIREHRYDHLVEDREGAGDDVEVAVRHRVERTGIERDLHPASSSACQRRNSSPESPNCRSRTDASRPIRAAGAPRRGCFTTTTPPAARSAPGPASAISSRAATMSPGSSYGGAVRMTPDSPRPRPGPRSHAIAAPPTTAPLAARAVAPRGLALAPH